MKNRSRYFFYVILIITTYCKPAMAQKLARVGPAQAKEIAQALDVVTHHMDSAAAHRNYIWALNLDNPLLIPQYRAWMKKYPKNITIPLTIGTIFNHAEMAEGKEFLLRASELDPKNAEVWAMLGSDAFTRGEINLSAGYMKKASLTNPSNAGYAAQYLLTFTESNSEEYRRQALDFAKRFPTDERGAQVLYWAGVDATDISIKITYLEKLRALYPPKKFTWSMSGMDELIDAYIKTDPEKAVRLTDSIGGKQRRQAALALIQIGKLEQTKNYKEAFTTLDTLKLPRFNELEDFLAFKKASLLAKGGDVKAAYNNLAENFAKLPTDEFYTAIEQYGKKLGKDKEQIASDIKSLRYAKAEAAYPFNLGLYTSKDSLSLKSLKGKVVLLTFWFPGCGPCRAEFPQ